MLSTLHQKTNSPDVLVAAPKSELGFTLVFCLPVKIYSLQPLASIVVTEITKVAKGAIARDSHMIRASTQIVN